MTMGVAAHFSFSRLLLAGTIGGLALTFASAAICGPSVRGNDRPAFSVRDVQTDRNDKDEDGSKKNTKTDVKSTGGAKESAAEGASRRSMPTGNQPSRGRR